MSDPIEQGPRSGDGDLAARLQAEVIAAAAERRRESPELARLEREVERAWAEIAPPGAAGDGEELLLERVERLAMVDVDAPLGTKPGVRQVKGAIRKGTYWYLRYLGDQLNAFHNVLARALRRIDERLDRLEVATGLARSVDALVDPAPVAGPSCGAAVAPVATGPVLVVAAGTGECLDALAVGRVAYGVEPDAATALVGIDAGRDVRVGDPVDHLRGLEADTLGAVVISGSLQRCASAGAIDLVDAVCRVVGAGGVVAVAVEDRSRRSLADRELLDGRGLAPATWATILGPVSESVDVVDVDDPGIEQVVIARLP